MNIPLPQSQIEWLKAQVAAGRFASLEEAVASAIAGLQEALEALDRDEGTPWRKGEILARIKARRASGA